MAWLSRMSMSIFSIIHLSTFNIQSIFLAIAAVLSRKLVGLFPFFSFLLCEVPKIQLNFIWVTNQWAGDER